MDATFIFLMFVLKLPIALLLYIVWWAVHATPETGTGGDEDDGGSKRHLDRHGHRRPHPRHPRHPRRGPHGDPPSPAPARTRTVVARARDSVS